MRNQVLAQGVLFLVIGLLFAKDPFDPIVAARPVWALEVASISTLAITPARSSVLVGASKQLVLFDCKTGKVTKELEFPRQASKVTALAAAAKGDKFFVATADGRLALWDRHLDKELHARRTEGSYTIAAFSPDDSSVVVADSAGIVFQYDAVELKEKWAWQAHEGQLKSLVFANDGSLISCGKDNVIRLWDVKNKKKKMQLEGPQERIQGLSLSPNQKLLAVASLSKRPLVVWNLETGLWRTLEVKGVTTFAGVAYSPDGSILVAASGSGVLHFYGKDEAWLKMVPVDLNGLQAVSFLDEKTLVTSFGSVKVWSLEELLKQKPE